MKRSKAQRSLQKYGFFLPQIISEYENIGLVLIDTKKLLEQINKKIASNQFFTVFDSLKIEDTIKKIDKIVRKKEQYQKTL